MMLTKQLRTKRMSRNFLDFQPKDRHPLSGACGAAVSWMIAEHCDALTFASLSKCDKLWNTITKMERKIYLSTQNVECVQNKLESRVNRYWEFQCKYLCDNVTRSALTIINWYEYYKQLWQFGCLLEYPKKPNPGWKIDNEFGSKLWRLLNLAVRYDLDSIFQLLIEKHGGTGEGINNRLIKHNAVFMRLLWFVICEGETKESNNKIANYLLQHPYINLNTEDGFLHESLLAGAVRKERYDMVELILKHPKMTVSILNGHNVLGNTILHDCCAQGSNLIYTLIDDKRIDINAVNADGMTPLLLMLHQWECNTLNAVSHNVSFSHIMTLLNRKDINVLLKGNDNRVAMDIVSSMLIRRNRMIHWLWPIYGKIKTVMHANRNDS